MKNLDDWQKRGRDHRRQVFWRFVLLASGIGLATGLWEAQLLYFVPSVREFLRVDIAYVIWFLAPLADLGFFALLGAGLGCVAAAGSQNGPHRQIMLAAVLLGVAGAMIGWSNHFVHTHAINLQVYSGAKGLLFPAARFAAVFILALIVARVWWPQARRLFSPERRWPLGKLGALVSAAALVLAAGVIFYAEAPRQNLPRVAASEPSGDPSGGRPNIVLITMDTVRADHLSSYGYARKTTPNIDSFARRGVLFENTVAATSWTLPSLASIFTGLLPHQNGANAFRPDNPGWVTLGETLRSYGYTTAGFNANCYYGQSGWGLADGFEIYDDDTTSLRYNLSRTLLGRVGVQPVYQNFGRYDAFFRRNAGGLNADIFHWLDRRPPQPFLLYINYFDAHSPYFSPAPFNHYFGKAPSSALRRIGFAGLSRLSAPLPEPEQQGLVSGYDDCLAYMDSQIGKLLDRLRKSPEWPHTIVIITADHGEAFGEHGVYQHANDLHWEEIHVPLMIAGPGIPAGRRVASPVPLRGLFSTVLDLALGSKLPFHPYSLARFWEQGGSAMPVMPVISELSSSLEQGGVGEISLTTAEWHYIRTERGKQELYRRSTDPAEKIDLGSLPEYQQTLQELHSRLEQQVGNSFEPWLGREYLFALGEPAHAPLPQNASAQEDEGRFQRAGAAQAYFHPDVPSQTRKLTPAQKGLLKSLPYQ